MFNSYVSLAEVFASTAKSFTHFQGLLLEHDKRIIDGSLDLPTSTQQAKCVIHTYKKKVDISELKTKYKLQMFIINS